MPCRAAGVPRWSREPRCKPWGRREKKERKRKGKKKKGIRKKRKGERERKGEGKIGKNWGKTREN
jgi:hypothetical protein